MLTDVSEVRTAWDLSPWWWRQCAPLKRRPTSTWQHGSTYQKTVNFDIYKVRMNDTYYAFLCRDRSNSVFTNSSFFIEICKHIQRQMTWSVKSTKGSCMAQVISRRPVIAEAWVRAQVSPCAIYIGESGAGTGFSPSSSLFSCKYHSTMALHAHISSVGRTKGSFVAAVRKNSCTPSTWTTTTLYNLALFRIHLNTKCESKPVF